MDRQAELFQRKASGNQAEAGMGLIIGESQEAPLTKAQKAFNRLVKRIETLRRNIEKETERLKGLMEFYSAELHPLEVKILAARKAMVRLLEKLLTAGEVKKGKSRTALKGMIGEQLRVLMDMTGGTLEDDLAALFRAVEGKTVDDAKNEEFEELRRGWEEDLAEDGVRIDLSGLRPDMPPDEAAATLDELRRQWEAGRDAKEGARKKTKKQLAAEERERQVEELRQKDLGSLYRQLAKLLHPDLEQDPGLRAEKEAAMKRLTTAYKDNDLHALLKLEVEWITREQADASRLTDAKLKIYNEVLKEQVSELETALQEVAAHPRFSPLRQYMDPFEMMVGNFNVNRREVHSELKSELASLVANTEALAGPRAHERLQALLSEFRRSEREGPFGF